MFCLYVWSKDLAWEVRLLIYAESCFCGDGVGAHVWCEASAHATQVTARESTRETSEDV